MNNTDDTIRFKTMTCSYADGFLTDSKLLSTESNNCFTNFVCDAKIPPHKAVIRFLKLTINEPLASNYDQFKEMKFKIGFNFIEAKSYNDLKHMDSKDLFKMNQSAPISNMKNLIWSNDVYLKELAEDLNEQIQ